MSLGTLRYVVTATIFLCWNSAAWGEPTVKSGKVFRGPEGLQVTIVEFDTQPKPQAVILIKGAGSKLDGKAILHDMIGTPERMGYRMQLHGKDYFTITVRGSYGSWSRLLSLPELQQDISLSYDEELSKKLKAEELWELYEKQSKNGSLKDLQ